MFNIAKNQKSYTDEFKQQMVDLYNTGNYSYPKLESEYGVSRSTISSWVKSLSPIKVSETETLTLKEHKALQEENHRQKEYEVFSKQIKEKFEDSKQRYGTVKIHRALNDEGIPCSLKRVQRHMKKQGLRSVVVKRHHPKADRGTVPEGKSL